MKHGMRIGRKKPTRFYSWLNGTVFHKAMAEMRLSYDDKRIIECNDHLLAKGKKPKVLYPQPRKRVKRTQHGK